MSDAEAAAWVVDLIAAQRACKTLRKDAANPAFKKADGTPSKYATLDAVRDAIVEAFWANGYAIVQAVKVREDGLPVLETQLVHRSGESITSVVPLIATDNPQKLRASVTYARKTGVEGLAFVCAEEDDDGNSAASGGSGARSGASGNGTKKGQTRIGAERYTDEQLKPLEFAGRGAVLKDLFGSGKREDFLALSDKAVHAALCDPQPNRLLRTIALVSVGERRPDGILPEDWPQAKDTNGTSAAASDAVPQDDLPF